MSSSEYPFDVIDLGFMLIAPTHPVMLGACVAQYWMRRSPMVVRALLSAGADIPDTPEVRALLPALERIDRATLPAPRERDLMPRLVALLPGRREPEPVANPTGASFTPQPERPARPAAVRERPRWLEVVNDQPDLTPHALILGGSGVGKTTMATAIMADRGGRTVVLSPKVSAGGWSGAEVISLDDDGSYAPIVSALADLEDEKRRRIVTLRREGREGLEPLTIVMDELVDLTSRVPAAGELMVNLSSIGREINMRLVGVGTTDKALGIKGWASSRNNYVTIEMDQQRRAQITQGQKSLAVRAQDALALARAAQLRPWRGEPEPAAHATQNLRAPAPSPNDMLAGLLNTPLPAAQAALATVAPERAERLRAYLDAQQSVRVKRPDGGQVIVNVAQVAGPGRAPTRRSAAGVNIRRMRERADKYRQVKALVVEGKSGNKIDEVVPGRRKKVLGMVREAKRDLGIDA